MTEESSFGSRAATLSGARELLDLERSEGRAERFAALDALVGDVVTRTLHAQRVVESERGRNTATVSLAGLDPKPKKPCCRSSLSRLSTPRDRGSYPRR